MSEKDGKFWPFTRNGQFSTKSAYKALTRNNSQGNSRVTLSGKSSKNYTSLIEFFYLDGDVLEKSIPSKEFLSSQMGYLFPLCPACEEKLESIEHVLFS